MIKEIQDKYAKLNITNQNKVQEAMKHEIRLVFDTIDAYFGRYGIKNRNVLPTSMGILTMLSNLNMLGRVSITSLGDIAQIFQNSVNYTSAIKGLGATNLFKATCSSQLILALKITSSFLLHFFKKIDACFFKNAFC